MAIVTGTFAPAQGSGWPSSTQPELLFVPSKPTITIGGTVVSTRTEPVKPGPTGEFSVNLIPTVYSSDSAFFYTVRGSYLVPNGYNDGAGFNRLDVFEQKIYVPPAGGRIGDLALIEDARGLYYEGNTPPRQSMRWLYLEPTYDPASGFPRPIFTAPDGTTVEHGELVEWSA